jgi:uncharacterized protein
MWHRYCGAQAFSKMTAAQAKNTDLLAESQTGLVSAMMKPGFYPNEPTQVIHKETHISHVFLAGDLVYKIKKAVRLSFLDYSTLAKRHHFLHEELRLNRRLAPAVYLEVMPITLEDSTWKLGGRERPQEYTLVMRRLPEGQMLPALLRSCRVTAEMMRALAEVLARFHSDAEQVTGIEASRHPETVEKQWNDNLAELVNVASAFIDHDTLEALEAFGQGFIRRKPDLFRRRAAEGWIRDVHGDLHCEHVCFAPDGIQIYDCIEFSPALRRCDLASEVGFLLMDLEVRGGETLARTFLSHYLKRVKDPELSLLLPYYKCYRALVRGKVEAMRGEEAAERAARYFRYASRLTWEPLKPFLIMVCGLTGSGKSTLAKYLGERLGLPVINSDVVRKELAGDSGRHVVAFERGIYSQAMTDRTYAEIARLAEKEITATNGAILDATFGRRADRERVLRLAAKHSVPLAVIHCVASDETTKKRLARRAEEGKDISDGRWEIYVRQKETSEPLTDIPQPFRLEVDTEPELEQVARASEKFLRSRLEQRRAY